MNKNAADHGEKRLLAVQALRSIAATMIVMLHAQEVLVLYAAAHSQSFVPLRGIPLGTGVDLFFVISGFVIAYASKSLFGLPGARWEFLRRRLIRIVPLYWTALSLRVLVLLAGAHFGTKSFPDPIAIVTSYLFIPYDALGYGSDYPFPILDLGWSLNYEMFFYLLFACFIGLRRNIAVPAVVTFLVVGIVLATFFPPETLALRFWLRPITLEFASGTLIALLFLRGFVLPNPVRVALVAVGIGIWFIPLSWFTDMTVPGLYSWPRLAVWGAGAIMIVAAAALGPTSFKSAWSRAIAALGDSSYALYLMHPFVFLALRPVLYKLNVPPLLYWSVVIAFVAAAIVVATLFHRLVEVPVVELLRKQTAPRPRPAPVAETG